MLPERELRVHVLEKKFRGVWRVPREHRRADRCVGGPRRFPGEGTLL